MAARGHFRPGRRAGAPGGRQWAPAPVSCKSRAGPRAPRPSPDTSALPQMFAPPSKRRGGPRARGVLEEPGARARPGPHVPEGQPGRRRRAPALARVPAWTTPRAHLRPAGGPPRPAGAGRAQPSGGRALSASPGSRGSRSFEGSALHRGVPSRHVPRPAALQVAALTPCRPPRRPPSPVLAPSPVWKGEPRARSLCPRLSSGPAVGYTQNSTKRALLGSFPASRVKTGR